MKRITLTLMILALVVCSCDRNKEMQALVQDGTVRLTVGGVTQFTYDPSTCQMGFCREKGEFRMGTDNMSDYFILKVSAIPTSEGEVVSGDLVWTTWSSIQSKNRIALEAVKLEGDKIWLWNSSTRIGAVVRVLE